MGLIIKQVINMHDALESAPPWFMLLYINIALGYSM